MKSYKTKIRLELTPLGQSGVEAFEIKVSVGRTQIGRDDVAGVLFRDEFFETKLFESILEDPPILGIPFASALDTALLPELRQGLVEGEHCVRRGCEPELSGLFKVDLLVIEIQAEAPAVSCKKNQDQINGSKTFY